MTPTRFATLTAVSTALLFAPVLAAQAPSQNIDAGHHPNLAAAQNLIGQAFDRIVTAQNQNNYNVGGHASRAKQLLVEASNELKAAALDANKR